MTPGDRAEAGHRGGSRRRRCCRSRRSRAGRAASGLSARLVRARDPSQVGARERFGDRVDAERRQLGQLDRHVVRIEHHDLAERPRIDEPHLVSVVERQRDVGVRRPGRAAGGEQHLAAHPEVDHHDVAGVERQQQVLAPAIRTLDHRIGQAGDQRLARRSTNDAFPTDLGTDDPATDEVVAPAPVEPFRPRAAQARHQVERRDRPASPPPVRRPSSSGPSPHRAPRRRRSTGGDERLRVVGAGRGDHVRGRTPPRPRRQLLELRLVVHLIEALDRRRESRARRAGRPSRAPRQLRRRGRRRRAPLRTRRTGSTASPSRPPPTRLVRAGCVCRGRSSWPRRPAPARSRRSCAGR